MSIATALKNLLEAQRDADRSEGYGDPYGVYNKVKNAEAEFAAAIRNAMPRAADSTHLRHAAANVVDALEDADTPPADTVPSYLRAAIGHLRDALNGGAA